MSACGCNHEGNATETQNYGRYPFQALKTKPHKQLKIFIRSLFVFYFLILKEKRSISTWEEK